MILITPCQSIPAVVQCTYQWLYGGNHDVQFPPTFDGNEWVQDPPARPQQYELFLDPWVESGPIFGDLVSKWKQERGVSSSTTDIILSPAYQAIIGMGQKVVPLILAQMESEGDDPDQWFWALQALTRTNPVAEENEGDFSAMAQDWIKWARKRYIW